MAGKDEKADVAAELKELRKKRTELTSQNEKAERELQAVRAKADAEQEQEKLARILELEKRKFEAEQKRAKELSDQLRRSAPQLEQKAEKEDARVVELGQTQKSAKIAVDPVYNFVVVKRFYGLGEFAKPSKKNEGVVGKTKKLVGI